ncbi:MAG TPA: hypothetical protein VF701_07290 [Thermoanaerobaculia bacterium]
MIWREKRVLLASLAVLLLANVVFFFTYRIQYQNRLDALDTRLEQAQLELERARNARTMTERTLQSYRQVEQDVVQVFDSHWATQTERLTPLISEVKRLAVASSLVPASYSFAQSQGTTLAAARRESRASLGASEVGISFVVQGTYEQVRRLINLLELSEQFVIINGINLAQAGDRTLTLNLQLKTLFRDDPPAGSTRNNRL